MLNAKITKQTSLGHLYDKHLGILEFSTFYCACMFYDFYCAWLSFSPKLVGAKCDL